MRIHVLILVSLLGMAAPAVAQQERPYDKQGAIWLDYDMEPIAQPAEYVTGQMYEFTDGTFFQQTKEKFDLPRVGRKLAGKPKEAYNVNSMDEVPDSSWFTNRNGRKRMSVEEIRRGPNTGPEMDTRGPLTVTRGKTSGISAGFWVKDSRGDTYILKFDRPEYPEMATAAEAIATRLFYAAGYNVPENNVCYIRREQLRLGKDAKFKDRLGFMNDFTEAELDDILRTAYRLPDGRYRCLASKLLPGKPVGGFAFAGVRKDDANDIIPHEHRRDLRGLRVFAAWLEHNDLRPGNTLDVYVTADGRGYLRHYLIDLGSTLGSDTVMPNKKWVGRQHIFDLEETLKSFFTFGIYQPPWSERERQLQYEEVGFYSAEFEPAEWKSNFPLPAFENMTERDAYWAAKIVASFTDEQIEAAVATGEISDPQAAHYLATVLKRRRDSIAQRWLGNRTALADFRVEKRGEEFALVFEDLRVKHTQDEPAPLRYTVEAVGGKQLAQGETPRPEIVLDGALLAQIAQAGSTDRDRGVARVSLARAAKHPRVNVYLWRNGEGLEIVGVEN